MNLIKIIIYILELIAEGMSQEKAINKASNKFGMSASEIKKHI